MSIKYLNSLLSRGVNPLYLPHCQITELLILGHAEMEKRRKEALLPFFHQDTMNIVFQYMNWK